MVSIQSRFRRCSRNASMGLGPGADLYALRIWTPRLVTVGLYRHI